MPTRERLVERGRAEGRAATAVVLDELRRARLDRSLPQAHVARAVGISPSRYSRIERGKTENLSIMQAAALLSAVGLRLAVRAYPAGEPIRDQAHVGLLARLRACLHSSLAWQTEVPIPIRGDLRAWDAVIRGLDWQQAVEAETRPRDVQALRRRISLKQRDAGVAAVILLLADTRHNRALVRDYGDTLRPDFPIPGKATLELLRAGLNPGGSSVILL